MKDNAKALLGFGIVFFLLSCTTGVKVQTSLELKTEGQRLAQEKKFVQASEKLEQAVALRPDDAHLHFILGMVYYDLGGRRESLNHFERSHEIDPSNYQVEIWVGNVNFQLGQLSEAELAYSRALKLKPNDYTAILNLGDLAFKKKDYKSCQEYFFRYKKLVDFIDLSRLTEKEKIRYQKAIELLQACESGQHDNAILPDRLTF